MSNPELGQLVADLRGGGWRADAACGEANTDLFAPGDNRSRTAQAEHRRTAQRYCAGCPVITACNTYAGEQLVEGLWAGSFRTREHGRGKYTVTPLIPQASSRPKKACP